MERYSVSSSETVSDKSQPPHPSYSKPPAPPRTDSFSHTDGPKNSQSRDELKNRDHTTKQHGGRNSKTAATNSTRKTKVSDSDFDDEDDDFTDIPKPKTYGPTNLPPWASTKFSTAPASSSSSASHTPSQQSTNTTQKCSKPAPASFTYPPSFNSSTSNSGSSFLNAPDNAYFGAASANLSAKQQSILNDLLNRFQEHQRISRSQADNAHNHSNANSSFRSANTFHDFAATAKPWPHFEETGTGLAGNSTFLDNLIARIRLAALADSLAAGKYPSETHLRSKGNV
jgi:outer membrane protein OmpA-like peptidoglycan-associated protein